MSSKTAHWQQLRWNSCDHRDDAGDEPALAVVNIGITIIGGQRVQQALTLASVPLNRPVKTKKKITVAVVANMTDGGKGWRRRSRKEQERKEDNAA